MKLILKSALICCALLPGLLTVWTAPCASVSEGINWLSYKEGKAIADSRQKKTLIFFTAEWCAYCGKMDNETFKNPSVIRYINSHFIPVKVDFDRDNETASLFGVRGLPDLWFVSESGETISHRPGYISADTLLPLLKYVATNSYQKMPFSQFVKNPE